MGGLPRGDAVWDVSDKSEVFRAASFGDREVRAARKIGLNLDEIHALLYEHVDIFKGLRAIRDDQ